VGSTTAGTNLLDLVSVATVKARLALGSADTTSDARIASLISAVSAEMAHVMQRHTKSARRTETYTVHPGKPMLSLRGAPIVTVHSLKWGAGSDLSMETALVENTDFYAVKHNGTLRFLTRAPAYVSAAVQRPIHPSNVEVEYTGGLADTTDNLVANGYGDIAEACALQVAYVLKRSERGLIGALSEKTGESSIDYTADYELLPAVAAVCERYRRRTG
jgi:hypothetical protein